MRRVQLRPGVHKGAGQELTHWQTAPHECRSRWILWRLLIHQSTIRRHRLNFFNLVISFHFILVFKTFTFISPSLNSRSDVWKSMTFTGEHLSRLSWSCWWGDNRLIWGGRVKLVVVVVVSEFCIHLVLGQHCNARSCTHSFSLFFLLFCATPELRKCLSCESDFFRAIEFRSKRHSFFWLFDWFLLGLKNFFF